MSYDGLLPHTAEIRRDVGAVDRFQQPVGATSPVGTYFCRLGRGSGGERHTDRSRGVVIRSFDLFLPMDADITEDDTVTVLDRTGRVLASEADVEEVAVLDDAYGPHHIEAKISITRSSRDAPGP